MRDTITQGADKIQNLGVRVGNHLTSLTVNTKFGKVNLSLYTARRHKMGLWRYKSTHS